VTPVYIDTICLVPSNDVITECGFVLWSHAKFGATFLPIHVRKFLETSFQLKEKLICYYYHHHHHPFFPLVVMQCKDFQHKNAYLLEYCGYVLTTFQVIHPSTGILIHQLLNPGRNIS